jgi:ubiquinone/menaquinone biosynthesis C-methylase UbiE
MLPRTLEEEVMDTEQEARDYDAMDHAEVNGRFCADLLAARPGLHHVLDVGTGTARIPIELCHRCPDARVVGIDLADHMLAVGKANIVAAQMAERIRLERRDAKHTGWGDGTFDVVMSNTILHHIPDPSDLLREMWRLTAKGGTLFVRDLARPDSAEAARALVDRYAGEAGSDDPRVVQSHARQKALLEASLHAALTVPEMQERLRPLGIAPDSVKMTSDRHWTLVCTK